MMSTRMYDFCTREYRKSYRTYFSNGPAGQPRHLGQTILHVVDVLLGYVEARDDKSMEVPKTVLALRGSDSVVFLFGL